MASRETERTSCMGNMVARIARIPVPLPQSVDSRLDRCGQEIGSLISSVSYNVKRPNPTPEMENQKSARPAGSVTLTTADVSKQTTHSKPCRD